MRPLVVVVGPTAAGKSALAVRLATALDAEVVSADSQQVYRGFDVGTGKPTLDEQRGVPHHLIDVVDPKDAFSAARFVRLADEAVAAIAARGRRVVVAGGTGLYVRALLHGLFASPAPDPDLRREHRRAWDQDPSTLLQRLQQVDPAAAARIMPNDFVRVSRALEVFDQTGVPISTLHEQHAFAARRYSAVLVGLSPTRAVLRRRIDERVDRMMSLGWLQEVERLLAAGHGDSQPMAALGYRQLRAHLLAGLDLGEALRQTKRDTWRFARRQLSWFSTESEIRWHEDGEQVPVELVLGHLRRGTQGTEGA